MFESFEPRKTEKAKCPQKKRRREEKNSTLPKTMPQAAGKNSHLKASWGTLRVVYFFYFVCFIWNQRVANRKEKSLFKSNFT